MLSLSLRSLLECVSFLRLCSRYFVYFFFGISSNFRFDGSVSFLFAFLALCMSQAFLFAILSLWLVLRIVLFCGVWVFAWFQSLLQESWASGLRWHVSVLAAQSRLLQ